MYKLYNSHSCFSVTTMSVPSRTSAMTPWRCVHVWIVQVIGNTQKHSSPTCSSTPPRWRRDGGAVFWLQKECLPLGCGVAPVPFSPCSWSYQSQMLRSSTTLCPPCLSSRRMVPREEDDKRLCLLLLTDLDDLTPAPHCSNRQHKMLT
ncbi:hypothetical protein F2P81_004629 [Scophthalmus maximus]|uniref:Uncharacterized protein n=1 Tax=Scophthalmus maximus TaxID=52904 RepID=A0A6A4TMS1_SCOMX|nr:hypothetical protein F2P81_004629 [Scophthalmus maximus]